MSITVANQRCMFSDPRYPEREALMSTFDSMLVVLLWILLVVYLCGMLWLWTVAPWRIEIDGMVLQGLAALSWLISIGFMVGYAVLWPPEPLAWVAWTWFGVNLAFPVYSWVLVPMIRKWQDRRFIRHMQTGR